MNGQRTACAPGSTRPVTWPALPITRREQTMKAADLQPPAAFYHMIEARGDRALIDSFLLKRPSIGARMAAGKALRKQVPRSGQATLDARTNRPDPVDILAQQDATRVKELVPVRHARMLENPF